MDKDKAMDSIGVIKSLMENSKKALWLNGVAAIFVGVYAILAAVIAYMYLGTDGDSFLYTLKVNSPGKYMYVILLTAVLLFISIFTVVILSIRKANQQGKKLSFDTLTLKMLTSFFVPLVTGGMLCIAFILQGLWGVTSSIMLVFYGTALVNASNHTYSDSKYLGYAFILLGVIDALCVNYALIFWVVGFGGFHIIYGIYSLIKHKK